MLETYQTPSIIFLLDIIRSIEREQSRKFLAYDCTSGTAALPISQVFLLHHKTETARQNAGAQKLKEPQVGGESSLALVVLSLGDLCADLAKGDGEDIIFIQSRGIPSKVVQAPKHPSSLVVAVCDHTSSLPLPSGTWRTMLHPTHFDKSHGHLTCFGQ